MRARGRFHRFRRRSHEARIPGESLADIAFLLVIFFLTTTVLRIDQGLSVDLPRAQTAMLQPREQIAHVWVDAAGRTMVDDLFVRSADLGTILARKLRANPHLIVAINCDRRTPYHALHVLLGEIKKAETVRVSFTAERQNPVP